MPGRTVLDPNRDNPRTVPANQEGDVGLGVSLQLAFVEWDSMRSKRSLDLPDRVLVRGEVKAVRRERESGATAPGEDYNHSSGEREPVEPGFHHLGYRAAGAGSSPRSGVIPEHWPAD